ncbi:MAG: 2OG-Fe(II) oxygenase [Alphaproteobacteria bacterium]|nr:2OG-Fe(II) oxygenase [Alphaproteobacteria bacterium]
MPAIDLSAFASTPLVRDPYDHVIVRGFLKPDAIGAIEADYPEIGRAGSFPLGELSFGPAFAAMVEELESPPVARAFGEKFGVDLAGRPTMVTARGRCQAKDGRIHTDSETKIITVLIYMNSSWEQPGGRLRVLRSADDLEDYAAEVPPDAGTLLAFRRSAHSYHGHRRFTGPRRVIQLNWVTDDEVVRREQSRHRLSAWVKKLVPFAGA